jgi:hypothetical protein
MYFKYFAVILLSMTLFSCGSGSGSSGLNGGITVTATATGPTIVATATYTNPTATNLIGVPITFSVQIGNTSIPLGTHSTNNSGAVSVAFSPPAFNGTQTLTVSAGTGNLTNFAPVTMTGRTMLVTQPADQTLTTTAATGSQFPFLLPSSTVFVTITDPFSNEVSGHTLTISASVSSSNTADTFNSPSQTTTDSTGKAPFPTASGTLIVPSTVSPEVMTITFTVIDSATGLTGTGITTIKLTKT